MILILFSLTSWISVLPLDIEYKQCNGDKCLLLIYIHCIKSNDKMNMAWVNDSKRIISFLSSIYLYSTFNVFSGLSIFYLISLILLWLVVPDGPIHNLTALNFSSTAIIVSWDPPISPNGRVFYLLTLKEARDTSGNQTDKTTSDTVFLFTKLKKYTDYVLSVTPATSAGHSENSTTVLHLRTDDDSELIAIGLLWSS